MRRDDDRPAGGRPAADPLAAILGESARIVSLRESVRRLLARQADARRLSPILLEGETGTGKGLLARAMHRAGPRRDGPFVEVNCSTIPETLLEAELFGHERGAFTDAKQARAGLFMAANHGTIFLDEIGTLPEGLQPKLLTALEERAVRRLGSTRSEPIDIWIIAATNEDLATATRGRRFREDLYHRLAVLTLRVPPLREREADVVLLAEHFLARACADYDMPPKALDATAREALRRYPWPGNIRELANVIERVVLLSDAPVVTAEMLDLPDAGPRGTAVREAVVAGADAGREDLVAALQATGWNVSRAAARLGISRNTMRYRMEKYRIRPDAGGVSHAVPADAPAATGPTAGAVGSDWERRRVALLRVVLAPEDAAAHLDASQRLTTVVEKIESFGGRIEEVGSMAITAAFGLEPVDDAHRRAVLAALAVQNAVERRRPGGGLRAKIGIHIVRVLLRRSAGVVEIHPGAREAAWAVLAALTAGEPGRILIEAADRGAPTVGPPLDVEALDASLGSQPTVD
jgi:DNA-binding NtrC family response regulator